MTQLTRFVGARWLLGLPLAAVGAANGQLINDGNFDALAIGTAPDVAMAAGAWQFPANYCTLVPSACEVDPAMYTIVATGSFQSGFPGNSLALAGNDAVNNIHLANLLPATIIPPAGAIVRVDFDIWVQQTGAGGAVYVGRDMGGGGLSNATDRGPQIWWLGTGALQYNAGGVLTTVVPAYPRAQWQHVRFDIHFDLNNYDLYWAPLSGDPLQLLGTGLGFRVPAPAVVTGVDRISIAHFGATAGLAVSSAFFDNFTVAIINPPVACYPNCDGSTTSPCLTVQDFGCFLNRFAAGDSYANCDGSTAVPVLTVQDFGCFLNSFAAGCSGC
jgi:hypothetical protein